MGEITRALALSRTESVPLSASIASLVVERILDGVVLALFLFATISAPGFPLGDGTTAELIRRTANVGAVVFSVGLGMLWFAARNPAGAVALFDRTMGRWLPDRYSDRASGAAAAFVVGLGALARTGVFVRALFWSFVVWIDLSLSIWAGVMAFGITGPGVSGSHLPAVDHRLRRSGSFESRVLRRIRGRGPARAQSVERSARPDREFRHELPHPHVHSRNRARAVVPAADRPVVEGRRSFRGRNAGMNRVPETVRRRAPAKLNLRLRVLQRDEAGYHGIETLMLALDLSDRIDLIPGPAGIRTHGGRRPRRSSGSVQPLLACRGSPVPRGGYRPRR